MEFLLTVIGIVLVYFFIKQYNVIQHLTQNIRESQSNIQVILKQKVEIINQFTELVNEYNDYETLTQLQVSDNYKKMSEQSAAAVTTIQQLASTYPELKSNSQYSIFLEKISMNEVNLTERREAYNKVVKIYNSSIAQIPMVFVASILGIKEAPYFTTDNEDAINTFQGANPEAIKELAMKGKKSLEDTFHKNK